MATHSIDWDAIHHRLATAGAALAEGREHSPEETHRILAARARAAARPVAEPDVSERLEILAFSLAGETYGIESCFVREVCQLRDLTALPCTPPFVAGVMNLRSQILAVVNLRVFFDLPARGLTELNRVIVLSDGTNELGLLADTIDGLGSLKVADLQAGLSTLTGIRGRFLKGVTGTMFAVLDGARLLEDEILKINDKATTQLG